MNPHLFFFWLAILHLPPTVAFFVMVRDPIRRKESFKYAFSSRWWIINWLRLQKISLFLAFLRVAILNWQQRNKPYPPGVSPWDLWSIIPLFGTLTSVWIGFFLFVRYRYWREGVIMPGEDEIRRERNGQPTNN